MDPNSGIGEPMSTPEPTRTLTELPARPLFLVFAYYVFLFASAAALIQLVPGALSLLNAPLPVSTFLPSGMGREAARQFLTSEAPDPWRVVLETVVALAGACLLMLPVTWVYVQTRRKRGFRQSVV